MLDFVTVVSSKATKLYERLSIKFELNVNPFGIVNVSGVVVPLSTVTLTIARGAVTEKGI